MNELLQKHGCANVFSVPEGLKELMSDIAREVLREQPTNMYEFIANYLSVLLITREHGVLALRILDDLCDCKPSVSEHLMQLGMERSQAESLAEVIKKEVEEFEPVEGKEKVKEIMIMKKVLTRHVLDEEMASKVCQVARNAYRDYWYRKKLLEQTMKMSPDEPWEIAAQHTLNLYKSTKPSFSELTRATEKIQAAYRGYHIRKNLLGHLKPKKKQRPKVELPGPPIDIAGSREIDLGPVIDIKVREDNIDTMFNEYVGEQTGLRYDPMKTITHVVDEDFLKPAPPYSQKRSVVQPQKSLITRLPSTTSSQTSDGISAVHEANKNSMVPGLPAKTIAGGISALPSAKSFSGGMSTKSDLQTSKSIPLVEEKSRVDRQYDEVMTPRQSRMSRQTNSDAQRRLTSQSQDQLLRKISFDEKPTEIISDIDDMTIDHQNDEDETSAGFPQEVQEEPVVDLAVGAVEAVEAEHTLEVFEEIPDDRFEGDVETAPTISEPTSEPVTADVDDDTDVEYDIEETPGEDDEK